MERAKRGTAVGKIHGRSHVATPTALLLCVILLAGCHPFDLRNPQDSPALQIRETAFLPVSDLTSQRQGAVVLASGADPASAEADLTTGMRREREGADACVDAYFRAVVQAWRCLESASYPTEADPEYRAAWRIYQQSLARLIPAASRFGRLDPRVGLVVDDGSGRRLVPVRLEGFAWRPADFCQVLPAADFQDGDFQRHYRMSGLGVALVAVRRTHREEPFFRPQQPFAATAVLRATGSGAVLEFYNPCAVETLTLGATTVRLERDLTAPFVWLARQTSRIYIEGFLDPGDGDVRPKLFMREPYQQGKIPVVLIHGLLSDPTTWLDVVNELQAHPDLYRQYQVWYFRYPTGGSILESAATLREQLLVAREQSDPAHCDKALTRMVLIGHSMGGLIAKLQATYSYDILWRHAARQPLEAVRAAPNMIDRLERDFFFDPSPLVSRVVFIGTPHHGSTMARRGIGRLASNLVTPFGKEEPLYQQLMRQNSDVFFEYLQKSPPTSIDLLEPDNPLLDALAKMPYGRCVRRHTLIGTGGGRLGGEPSDGVVPVSSARQPEVCSEFFVPARHTRLHHDPTSLAEVMRILYEHLQPAGNGSPVTAVRASNGHLAAEAR